MAVIKFTQQERPSLIQLDWAQVLKSGPQFLHLALGGSLSPGAGCYRSKSTNVLWYIHRDWLPIVGKTSLQQEGRRHDTKRSTWVLCLWQSWKLWKWPWWTTKRSERWGERERRHWLQVPLYLPFGKQSMPIKAILSWVIPAPQDSSLQATRHLKFLIRTQSP